MRTTKAEVLAAFERLVEAVGGRIAESYNDVGAYVLDHDSTYGGYVIHRHANDSGAVDCPFGMRRLAASEFVTACHFAISAMRAKV